MAKLGSVTIPVFPDLSPILDALDLLADALEATAADLHLRAAEIRAAALGALNLPPDEEPADG